MDELRERIKEAIELYMEVAEDEVCDESWEFVGIQSVGGCFAKSSMP